MNDDLLGKCGFYCASCPTYLAAKCSGCMNEHTKGDCFTRDCVISKKLQFCGECTQFPCKTIMEKERCTVLNKSWLLWKRQQHDETHHSSKC